MADDGSKSDEEIGNGEKKVKPSKAKRSYAVKKPKKVDLPDWDGLEKKYKNSSHDKLVSLLLNLKKDMQVYTKIPIPSDAFDALDDEPNVSILL